MSALKRTRPLTITHVTVTAGYRFRFHRRDQKPPGSSSSGPTGVAWASVPTLEGRPVEEEVGDGIELTRTGAVLDPIEPRGTTGWTGVPSPIGSPWGAWWGTVVGTAAGISLEL